MKKIGILFGMENTFPPALVERINGMKVEGVTAEFVKVGGVQMAEPSGYRRDRRSHLARHPVLSRVPEERRADRHEGHQQSVLVERRRQVLQLRAGREAGRRHSAHRAAAAQEASRPAPPIGRCATCSTRSTGTRSSTTSASRRSSSRIDGGGWKRRVQGQLAGRVLRRLRPDRRPLHDAAARRRLQGVLPLLRGRAGEGAHHALRPAAPFHERYVQNPPCRSQAARPGASSGRADALPRARLRPEHGGVRGRRRRALRDRLS